MHTHALTSVPGIRLAFAKMSAVMASNLPGDCKENTDGHSSIAGQSTLPGCQGPLQGRSGLQAPLSGSWP